MMGEITPVGDGWLERSRDTHVMSPYSFSALTAAEFHPFPAIYLFI